MGGCITRTPLSGGARSAGPTHAADAPVATPGGEGWSTDRGEPRQRHGIAPSLQPAGRLSRYPTRTPSAVSGHAKDPQPPARGTQWAAHGPGQGPRGRLPSLRWSRWRVRRPWRTSRQPDDPFPLVMSPGGVERPRRIVRFARLMHRRVRVFWPAFGLRRLWRQSMPVLVATRGDTAAPGHRPSTTDMIARAHLSYQLMVLILLVLLFVPLGCLFWIGHLVCLCGNRHSACLYAGWTQTRRAPTVPACDQSSPAMTHSVRGTGSRRESNSRKRAWPSCHW
jgi:hypothetical protein